MAITLNLPSVLAAHTGGARTIEATGRTLGEAVADVAARYPALAPRLQDKEGKPYPFVNFYLNDEDVRFRGGFPAARTPVRRRTPDRRPYGARRSRRDSTGLMVLMETWIAPRGSAVSAPWGPKISSSRAASSRDQHVGVAHRGGGTMTNVGTPSKR